MTDTNEPQKAPPPIEREKPQKVNPGGEISIDGGGTAKGWTNLPGEAGGLALPPNHYRLHGGPVSIVYDPAGAVSGEAAGAAILRYQDDQLSQDFHAHEVRYDVVPRVGTFVTATLLTGETDFTTASLLLPDVSLTPGESTPVDAILITRSHQGVSGEQGEPHGGSYTVAELSGDAIGSPLTQGVVVDPPSDQAIARQGDLITVGTQELTQSVILMAAKSPWG